MCVYGVPCSFSLEDWQQPLKSGLVCIGTYHREPTRSNYSVKLEFKLVESVKLICLSSVGLEASLLHKTLL